MANRTRNHELKYRLNDKEYEKFKRLVKKTGLTQQAFIKKAIDGAKIIEQPPAEFFEVLKELRGIQMNMTFMWLNADSSGDYTAGKQYYDDKRRLEKLVGDLMGAYL